MQVTSRFLFLVAFFATLLLFPGHAWAENLIVVTTTQDEINADGDCSLREAVKAANENRTVDRCTWTLPGEDVIALMPGIYTLTIASGTDDASTGDLDISDRLRILGLNPDAADAFALVPFQTRTEIVSGVPNTRIFEVRSGVRLELIGLDLHGGSSTLGGAILNSGETFLHQVTLAENTATYGSAIFNNAGVVSVFNSTISGNTATIDGTLINHSTGTTDIVNSTISGNRAGRDGGAMVVNGGEVFAFHATIVQNRVDYDNMGGGSGGGVYMRGGKYTTFGSIYENYVGTPGTPNDCHGEIISKGHNVVRTDDSPHFDCVGWSHSVDITLRGCTCGPLEDNGGPTKTHALNEGSPAIDLGTDRPTLVMQMFMDVLSRPPEPDVDYYLGILRRNLADQRGAPRSDERADSGAFEFFFEQIH